jgi:hypothetical protein
MLNISERDLYYFVMHPEKLNAETKKYIQRNLTQYFEQITFLKDFKVNLKKDVPIEIIDRIIDKIKNSIIKVDLKPVHQENNSEYIKYAAHSLDKISDNKFYTFQDESKNYLLKVNSNSEQSKIFLFSSKIPEESNILLLFNPKGIRYNMKISEQPLIVDRIDLIDSIQLSFIN